MDVDALVAKTQEGLTAGRCFGPVIERDGKLVIPAAFVIGGGGGGGGEGPTEGSGSGGGFFSVSWPLGAYVIRGDQVRWVPAIDATRVAIAAFAVARLAVRLRARRGAAPG